MKLMVSGVTLVKKVGVPIQKENDAPLGPELKGEEN